MGGVSRKNGVIIGGMLKYNKVRGLQMKLADIQCRNAKSKEKSYKLAIGVYSEIYLLEAREKKGGARKLIRDNIDPVQAKKEIK